MTNRPSILSAKVEKLAEILTDGNDTKANGNATVSEARNAQRDAAKEIMDGSFSSVSSVKEVKTPSERLNE